MARRRANETNAFVAAATRIRIGRKNDAEAGGRTEPWQEEAWEFFDEVPEVKQGIRYRANQVAKVHLFVAVDNPEDPDGDPIPVTDPASGVPPEVADVAVAELGRLRSNVGGEGEIKRMLDMNEEVCGECYLVGLASREREIKQRDGSVQVVEDPEDWQIKSISEVKKQDDGYYLLSRPGENPGRKLKLSDPPQDDDDTLIRLWTRHPRWSNLPDSALRGLLGDCRTLQVLSQQMQAEANSRQSAGAFTVPNELSFGPADPTGPDDGEDTEDPFQAELQRALVEPITDPSSAASVMPMLIRGPAEYLKEEYLRRIDFARDTTDSIDRRVQMLIERIARGLNLPPEKVLGHQQTTFANAAQVDEDEFNDYLAPSCETMVDSLTWAFLRPQLEENPAVGPDWVQAMYVWYDASDLIRQPDREANADAAHDRFVISDDAYRSAKGYSEDDAPDPMEIVLRAALKRVTMDVNVQNELLRLLGAPIPENEPEPEQEQEPAEEVEPDARVRALALLSEAHAAAARGEPPGFGEATALQAGAVAAGRPDWGHQLAAIDRDLRTRLLTAANAAMDRALERAGNRLRSRTNGSELRAALRNVAADRAWHALGRTVTAALLDPQEALAGAWDELERQFRMWGEAAQEEALDLAGRIAAGFTSERRGELRLRQAADLDEAWGWMREALGALAEARMFDPDPDAPDAGEFDPTLRVPTGLVRQAITRAGGATGVEATDKGGAYITLADGGTRPAGGIGTGEVIREVLRDGGAGVEAYRWVYGPMFRQRPFDPHQRLDGTIFRQFDDAVLANPDSFPPFAFYMPGDHAGCSCDVEPIIVPAEDVD